jgi:hypothetical protein
VPMKTCPSPECSGHGACLLQDASFNTVNECPADNAYCFSRCSCLNGFQGSDCSLPPILAEDRDYTRGVLCQALVGTLSMSDPSPQLLSNLVTSISFIFNSYEVTSNASVSSCASLLSNTMTLVKKGYLSGASENTITTLLQVISSFLLVLPNYPSLSSELTNSVSDFTRGVLLDMSEGQAPVTVSSDNLDMKVLFPLTSDLHDTSLSPPFVLGRGPPASIALSSTV